MGLLHIMTNTPSITSGKFFSWRTYDRTFLQSAKPRKFARRDISQEELNKRQEIMPQNAFYNPGSAEVSRLSFEDQNAEQDNRFYQSANSDASTGLFNGYQGNEEALRGADQYGNGKEAMQVQQGFLDQSEVQRPSAEYVDNRPIADSMVDEAKSYETTAGLNQARNSKMGVNPFEMPAGYPDQDGYKKSTVTKQNLPLNEPHPGKSSLINLKKSYFESVLVEAPKFSLFS